MAMFFECHSPMTGGGLVTRVTGRVPPSGGGGWAVTTARGVRRWRTGFTFHSFDSAKEWKVTKGRKPTSGGISSSSLMPLNLGLPSVALRRGHRSSSPHAISDCAGGPSPLEPLLKTTSLGGLRAPCWTHPRGSAPMWERLSIGCCLPHGAGKAFYSARRPPRQRGPG